MQEAALQGCNALVGWTQRYCSCCRMIDHNHCTRVVQKGGVEITPFVALRANKHERLTAEAVQGTSLPLQGVHDIKGSDCLAACVLCVGDCISDNVLQEHL